MCECSLCVGSDWSGVSMEQFVSCPFNLAFNRQTRMLADLSLVHCYNFSWSPLPLPSSYYPSPSYPSGGPVQSVVSHIQHIQLQVATIETKVMRNNLGLRVWAYNEQGLNVIDCGFDPIMRVILFVLLSKQATFDIKYRPASPS